LTPELFTRISTNNDEFERDQTARGLFGVVAGLESASPLVVGIHGTWGSGKTDFMKRNKKLVKADDESYKTVWFTPWKYERKEDVGAALIQTILRKIEIEKMEPGLFKKLRSQVGRVISGTASAAGQITIGLPAGFSTSDLKMIVEGFKAGYAESNTGYVTELDELIDELGKVIANWTVDHRLVLFIDDLDRCLPDQMIRALEAIHLYLASLPMIAFIALDRGAFSSAVEDRFGQTYEGAAYIEKIIDVAFDLPAPSPEQLNARYRPRLEALKINSDNIGKILQRGFGSNPRTYERFINRMIGLSAAFSHLGVFNVNFYMELLALLVMVQKQFPDLFDEILVDPLGFRAFVEEAEAPNPNPDQMAANSAIQYAKFFGADRPEWQLFNATVVEARAVCKAAGFEKQSTGPAWEEISIILGSSAS